MKSIKSLTVFYFLLSSVSGASATVTATENWGDLIDDVARLTWAENNCNGQVPDFVRELRIYIRRQAGAALHEAELRVNNDIRLTINSGAGSIGKEDAIRWYCVGLNRLYGERGRMPGFWLADGAWVGTAAPKGNTRLARYGEIVRILATLEET